MASMELFRGKGRRTWQLRITDHQGFRRQLSTHTERAATARAITHKIELLIDYRLRGDVVPGELVQWLHGCHQNIREKLTEWEIVQPRTAEGGRPLYHDPRPDPLPADWKDPPASLVELWYQELSDREVTDRYADESMERVRTLLAMPAGDCRPIRYIQDLSAEGILARVRELRRIGPPVKTKRVRKKLSPQTCEHYLARAREFLGWLITKGYLAVNPLAGVCAYTPEVIAKNKSRDRRALTRDEQSELVTGTPRLPRRWNMDGTERALLYRLALRTGLRANEIRTLKVCNFNFFARTVLVRAADGKARREETLPIAAELVPLLKDHFAATSKMPQAPAFSPLSVARYCRMLRDDLEELGMPYQDSLGRFADFHALRHTYGTELARVCMPAVHQKLMRHAKIETTMKYYTHIEDGDKSDALAMLAALPELPTPATEAG